MPVLLLALGLVVLEPQVATTAFLGASQVGAPADAHEATPALVEAALLANPAVTLQSRDATAQFMETAKGLNVDCDPALDQCLLELAGLCNVDQAVFGLVEGTRLTLRLAIVKGAVVRTVTTTLDVPQGAQSTVLAEAIAELVAPLSTAALVVDAPAGSFISLDGIERGTVPLASAMNGVAPGRHFVDVRFADGAVTTKAVVLSAGMRTRVIAVPRPLGADVLTWTGWGSLGVAAVSASIASVTVGAYLYARGRLENFNTHYANDVDYNDKATRKEAVGNQDLLTDLSTYGYPLFATAGVTSVVGGALLFVGYRWSDLFDPPSEETPQ